MRGFGGGMGGLMAQAQKMQAKIAKVQEEIAAMEVAGVPSRSSSPASTSARAS